MTTPHRTLREAAQMALDALLTGYHQGTQDAIAALREALAADHLRDVAEKVGPAAPVPDGWVMVPKEATREMCVAAVVLNNGNAVYKNVAAKALEIEEQIYGEVWSAMIAASPAAPAAPVVRELQDDLIESVIRDVAELDYSSLPDMPEVMLVTANELRGILQAHGITGASK